MLSRNEIWEGESYKIIKTYHKNFWRSFALWNISHIDQSIFNHKINHYFHQSFMHCINLVMLSICDFWWIMMSIFNKLLQMETASVWLFIFNALVSVTLEKCILIHEIFHTLLACLLGIWIYLPNRDFSCWCLYSVTLPYLNSNELGVSNIFP